MARKSALAMSTWLARSALSTRDRPTGTGGSPRSSEMIRDMMVRCVEQRLGTIRAPHPVQWLSDNGSIFAAHRTIEIALALNLVAVLHAG